MDGHDPIGNYKEVSMGLGHLLSPKVGVAACILWLFNTYIPKKADVLLKNEIYAVRTLTQRICNIHVYVYV